MATEAPSHKLDEKTGLGAATAAGSGPGLSNEDSTDSKCEIMNIYNHSTDSSERNEKWSEFEDLAAEEKRIKELGKAFAVIHRRSKVEKDEKISWITHSIEAQSPQLRELLDAAFQDYPSWYPDAAPYAVAPPFKPYVHRWNDILKLGEDLDKKTTAELQLLRREVEPLITSNLAVLDRVRKTRTISFENLWVILAPGCLVISNDKGKTYASKLMKVDFIPATERCSAFWVLQMLRVNWNGSYCGLEAKTVHIAEYKESILVTKLHTYPLEFAPDPVGTKAKLLARGRKFESLRGFHMKTCKGKKYTLEYNPVHHRQDEVEKPVSGRIIVDSYAYHKVQNEVQPDLIRLVRSRHNPELLSLDILDMMPKSERRRRHSYTSSEGSGSDNESEYDSEVEMHREVFRRNNASNASKKNEDVDRNEDLSSLTDLECILTVPRVKGFDLTAKQWAEFNVDEIGEVEWNESPYNNLVLPEGEKDLIIAFTDRNRLGADRFDDFMAHKGEGIIILLCGPPGVGKTLTAEAVAEKSRVPLYNLSAGDLGTDANKVESQLMKALECCQLWNAVLLLDEADVFLETRDSNSLDRNELVSIFLRRLEYYRGLMFLTTNRFGAIDPAFKSRLDLILPYSDLDEASRRKVWVNFIQKLDSGVASISDSEFDELAKTQLNGREIKNSIKMSLVLASNDKPLRFKHLKTVLDIHKRVENLG